MYGKGGMGILDTNSRTLFHQLTASGFLHEG